MACVKNLFRKRWSKKNPDDEDVVEDVSLHIEKALADKGGFRPSQEKKKSGGRKLPSSFSYIVKDVDSSTRILYERYCSMETRPPFFDERFESQRELWYAPSYTIAKNLRTNFLDVLAIQIWFAWNKALLSDRQDSLKYVAGYQDDLMTLALFFAIPAVLWRSRTFLVENKGISVEDVFDKVQMWIAHKTGEKVVKESNIGNKTTYLMGKNALDAYNPYRKAKKAAVKDSEEEDDDDVIEEEEARVNSLGIHENSFHAHISRYVYGAVKTLVKASSRNRGLASTKEPYNRGMVSLDKTVGDSDGEMLFSETIAGRDDYLIEYSKRGEKLIDDILKTLIRLVDPVELYTTTPNSGIALRDYIFYRLWFAASFEGGYTNHEVELLYKWGTRPWMAFELRENRALKGTIRNDTFYTNKERAVKFLTADFWKTEVIYTCGKCKMNIGINVQHCVGSKVLKTENILTYADKYRLYVEKNWSIPVQKDILARVRMRLIARIYEDGLLQRPEPRRTISKHREEAGWIEKKDELVKEPQAPIRHISVEEYLRDRNE